MLVGPGAMAAPAQLKGHVRPPTFTPVPPNCGSLTPTTTVLLAPSHPAQPHPHASFFSVGLSAVDRASSKRGMPPE